MADTTNKADSAASLATGHDLSAETFHDFVQRLRHHVRGAGVHDHCTADAIFIVQAKKIIYGIDRDYTDKLAVCVEDSSYFSPQEYWEAADEGTRLRLDEIAQQDGECPFLSLDASDQWDVLGELPDHRVMGWDEQWEYVNSHFTREAAEGFIRRKKHDYRDGLSVYVDAQSYCWEFNAIIDGLLNGQIVFAGQDAARIAELERQNGEMAKDAERYRWLRNKANNARARDPMCVTGIFPKANAVAGEALDKAIDAAIASAAGKEAPHDAKCTCDDCRRKRRPNPADGAPNPPGYRPYA